VQLTVLKEAGYKEAMLGLSLSYGQTWKPVDELKAYEVASRLSHKGDGHNKFLESMVVWLDITAPRFFWAEFDTYRVGVTKQSASTMHTLKRDGVQDNQFDPYPGHLAIAKLKDAVTGNMGIEMIKAMLPESFLQRRIVCLNYAVLQRMYRQRRKHRLPQWRKFCEALADGLKFPYFVVGKSEEAKHSESGGIDE
jgi:hypothetical protein